MKKYIYLSFFTLTGFLFSGFSQNPNRKLESFYRHNNDVVVNVNDGSYFFRFYSENIVETTFLPKDEEFNPDSHAVVMKPKKVEVKLSEKEDAIVIYTYKIGVIINKNPFKISYVYNEVYLLSEKSGYIKDTLEKIEFNLTKDEVLYGGGTRVLGMNRRGNRLELYNRAHYGYETHSSLMNYTLPMVLSSNLYAVHFDNPAIGFLDLDSKKDNTLTYETISGRKTYQVIAGDRWEEIIDSYTQLTGRQPMLPRWAFGNFSSRFGYHSQAEVLATAQKFRDENIPVDAIIIDLYWFGKDIFGTMGNLAFDRDSFPEPWQMVQQLKDIDVKTILVTEPFILTTSDRWDEAVQKDIITKDSTGRPFTYDFYFGNTGLLDLFDPKAQNWFWNFYKDFTKRGIAGWWGDLGEPEVHPKELRHIKGTADEVHNIYGHQWAKTVFEGYQKDFPDQRPFILMRSGYSGSQHYGIIPWTGDVNRTWGGLKGQTELSLQMGLQGIAYMHSDLGGFAGDYKDEELYTRWLQYGVFQPIYRPHAQEQVPSEPVFWDKKTKDLARKAIELRYQLLPYHYTMAFDNNQTGIPLMRPLFFEELNRIDLLTVADQYLWGNAFLVKPITDKNVTQTTVYFPTTADWYDFYTNQKHQRGAIAIISLVEENIPVFVRAGSFIPMVKTIQSTEAYSLKNFDLHYYFSENNSDGKLYNDDGITPFAFEKGQYEILYFSAENNSDNSVITITPEIGENFNSEEKNIRLLLHHFDKNPKKITINNKKTTFKWNGNTLEIRVPVHTKTVKINIQK